MTISPTIAANAWLVGEYNNQIIKEIVQKELPPRSEQEADFLTILALCLSHYLNQELDVPLSLDIFNKHKGIIMAAYQIGRLGVTDSKVKIKGYTDD